MHREILSLARVSSLVPSYVSKKGVCRTTALSRRCSSKERSTTKVSYCVGVKLSWHHFPRVNRYTMVITARCDGISSGHVGMRLQEQGAGCWAIWFLDESIIGLLAGQMMPKQVLATTAITSGCCAHESTLLNTVSLNLKRYRDMNGSLFALVINGLHIAHKHSLDMIFIPPCRHLTRDTHLHHCTVNNPS